MKRSIGIVGAGVCGSVCARELARRGYAVSVFDKGRGPGGRTSSRRTESGHRFDHGASRIDVTQGALHEMLAPAVADGVLTRAGDTYTSAAGLNALCKWLLRELPVRYSTKLERIRHDGAWSAADDAGESHGPFDAVVLAVPPVNAAEIVGAHDAKLAEIIAAVRMLPRWAVMLAFSERVTSVPDVSMVNGHVLRRSMSNTVGDALVVEADEEWSIENVELEAARVGAEMLEIVRPRLGSSVPTAVAAHRWRYAFVDRPAGRPFFGGDHGLYVCGDWCLGRSIESALQSAIAVVEAICETPRG